MHRIFLVSKNAFQAKAGRTSVDLCLPNDSAVSAPANQTLKPLSSSVSSCDS